MILLIKIRINSQKNIVAKIMNKSRNNWLSFISIGIGLWIGLQCVWIDAALAFEWNFNTDNLDSIVGNPPELNSETLTKDLFILKWEQETRTPEDIELSWHFLSIENTIFNKAIGINISQRNAPKLNAILGQLLTEAFAVTSDYKDKFKRLRPYLAYEDIQACLPPESSYSYPSGHSTIGIFLSELLADLFPESEARIKKVGAYFGYSRVICGVHFPSDIEAGKRLGKALAKQVLNSDIWRGIKLDLQDELDYLKQNKKVTTEPLLLYF